MSISTGLVSVVVILQMLCLFHVTLSDNPVNALLSVTDLDWSESGETVELKITLNKNPQPARTVSYQDCADIYKAGERANGVYTIKPMLHWKSIQVYCDMTEDGGGWTKLMRRQDGSESFARRWEVYQKGFGELSGEHWLGNDKISAITRQKFYMLRVRLWSFDNETRYADYRAMVVEPWWHKYRLHIGKYSGDAGDMLTNNNNNMFSTIDQDNDQARFHCGQSYSSGFRFGACSNAGLTNLYSHVPNIKTSGGGLVWKPWRGDKIAMEKAEMKIRPVDF